MIPASVEAARRIRNGWNLGAILCWVGATVGGAVEPVAAIPLGAAAGLASWAAYRAGSRLDALLDKAAAPRTLSEHQRDRIVQVLVGVDHGRMYLTASLSDEAMSFAGQLRSALQAGGFVIEQIDRGWYEGQHSSGLTIIRRSDFSRAADVLEAALKAAGLSFHRWADPTIAVDVKIFVGAKPLEGAKNA